MSVVGLRDSNRRIVWATLVLYAIGFFVWYPQVIAVGDEAWYVRQAALFAKGAVHLQVHDPITAVPHWVAASTYPVGTSVLQTPFVFLGGWRAAVLLSFGSLLVTTLVLVRWLRLAGRSPLFALLLLGFPATLVMGRIAMSDLPSAALVAVALYWFWSGCDPARGWRVWLGSGLLAGASLALRETNVLFFVPLFGAAVIRREPHAWALVLGSVAAASLRLVGAHFVLGDAFAYKTVSYGFSSKAILANAPLHLTALLFLVPGGLIAAILYRGWRWRECLATVLLVLGFFLFYSYAAADSGGLKQLVLGTRYFIPLVPLLAWCAAWVFPELWERWLARWPEKAGWWENVPRWGTRSWIAGVAIAAVAVHPVLWRWGATQAQVVELVYGHTTEDSALVANGPGVYKFIHELYGRRRFVNTYDVAAERVPEILRAHGTAFVVLVTRNDSAYFLEDRQRSDAYLEEVARACDLELVLEQAVGSVELVRILRIRSCSG